MPHTNISFTTPSARLTASSAVTGFGGRRFLVPQYEEAAKDCRCAGQTSNDRLNPKFSR